MKGHSEWRILPFQKLTAFENMAVDEAVLLNADSGNAPPTLRLYGWKPPAVSLGYFQDYYQDINTANCRALGLDIVRRPTGGKAVLHEHEVTYSVIAPRTDPLFPDSIIGTYKVISSCLAHALKSLGIHAISAEPGLERKSRGLDSFCFSEPSRHELLVAGRKICGSAQLRTKNAFLQHGSLLLDFDPGKASAILFPNPGQEELHDLARSVTSVKENSAAFASEEQVKEALVRSFRNVLGIELFETALSPEEEREKFRLVQEKYGTDKWNISGARLA